MEEKHHEQQSDKCHYTYVRVAKIKHWKNASEEMKEKYINFSHIMGRNVKWYIRSDKKFTVSFKMKHSFNL